MMKRIGILALLALPAFTKAAPEASVASGVRFPSFNDKGEMTSVIFGDTAKVMPNGYVELTNLRMEFYNAGDESHKVQMEVQSPHCLYHRERGAAASEKDVRIVNNSMVVTGTGFVWENQAQVLKIMKDSKVVLKGGMAKLEEKDKP